MIVDLQLYRLPGSAPWGHRHEGDLYPSQWWASGRFQLPEQLAGGTGTVVLDEIHAGSAAAWYRAIIDPGPEQPHAGWMTINVRLDVNNRRVGPWRPVPLTFYTGEVTDMCTGLVRFDEGYGDQCPHDGKDEPPAVWMLGARRSM